MSGEREIEREIRSELLGEDPDAEQPFQPDQDPFHGFEVTAEVDRAAYRAGDVVRVTVAATNDTPRFVVHRYPGWRRFELTVRDTHHRTVAETVADRAPDEEAAGPGLADRWLPGQMLILPVYWPQHEGPVVPGWSDEAPGPRVAPGSYRVRVSWLGEVPGSRGEVADAWTSWFEVV